MTAFLFAGFMQKLFLSCRYFSDAASVLRSSYALIDVLCSQTIFLFREGFHALINTLRVQAILLY